VLFAPECGGRRLDPGFRFHPDVGAMFKEGLGQLKPTKAVADEARKELRGQNGISNKQGRSRLKPKPKVGAAASGWQGTKPRGGLRKQVWKIV